MLGPEGPRGKYVPPGNQNPRPRPAAWEWPPLSPAWGPASAQRLAAVGLRLLMCNRDLDASLTEGPRVHGQGDRVHRPESQRGGRLAQGWSVGRGAAHLVSQHWMERFLFPKGSFVLGLQGEHRGAALATRTSEGLQPELTAHGLDWFRPHLLGQSPSPLQASISPFYESVHCSPRAPPSQPLHH